MYDIFLARLGAPFLSSSGPGDAQRRGCTKNPEDTRKRARAGGVRNSSSSGARAAPADVAKPRHTGTALHSSTLKKYTALNYAIIHCTALHRTALRYTTSPYTITLHCTAMH